VVQWSKQSISSGKYYGSCVHNNNSFMKYSIAAQRAAALAVRIRTAISRYHLSRNTFLLINFGSKDVRRKLFRLLPPTHNDFNGNGTITSKVVLDRKKIHLGHNAKH
jgi:hypothetical protein